ncbi:MAG: MarR family winged helix-turn-helix transcriptional regulator [bacterium]|nr:MarR family winged helix-turn-helix transcriptional regulator [bacterium]
MIKKSDPANGLSLHLLLLACHTNYNRLYMRELEKKYPGHNLLPGQPKILEFLKTHNNAYQRQIADGCLLEPSTLSLILSKMEAANLITRGSVGSNRKNRVVSLTPKGMEMADKVIEVYMSLEKEVQKTCTSIEKDNVRVILRKICEQETLMLDSEI